MLLLLLLFLCILLILLVLLLLLLFLYLHSLRPALLLLCLHGPQNKEEEQQQQVQKGRQRQSWRYSGRGLWKRTQTSGGGVCRRGLRMYGMIPLRDTPMLPVRKRPKTAFRDCWHPLQQQQQT